ncbi:MAG: hypothetical protein DHS80DRAFT_20243 [Piptocephalis tieghemiana]|nr:MAG: hypothetical protein DHS80DRAFT_20243 [Piptocephalis tieghemiana]
MGRLYALKFLAAGYTVNVCDLPSRFEELRKSLKGTGLVVLKDGHAVSRRSDFIIYSVEAELIDRVVGEYGPSTKIGAVVGGQTSVKSPEIEAFEKHLPEDVHIVTCHSMHGPGVDPKDQPLAIIRHRSSEKAYQLAKDALSSLGSNMVELDYQQHDRITADTQAVTHLAFLSMGTAWKQRNEFPWEDQCFVGGIENVKVNIALRIYANKWHVYAGLAILNPSAQVQVKQYARSVYELFTMMIQEDEVAFRERVTKAKDFVFGKDYDPILLSDGVLDRFSLSSVPKEDRKPNSHLSLLAMVDCWYQLGLNPYDHMVCQTPPFRLWLGIAEYCVTNEEMFQDAIHASLYDKNIRKHDLSFYSASQGWAQCVELGNMEGYRRRFQETAAFFSDRLPDASKLSSEMIRTIIRRTNSNIQLNEKKSTS